MGRVLVLTCVNSYIKVYSVISLKYIDGFKGVLTMFEYFLPSLSIALILVFMGAVVTSDNGGDKAR